jgi:hypothetical protein
MFTLSSQHNILGREAAISINMSVYYQCIYVVRLLSMAMHLCFTLTVVTCLTIPFNSFS